MHVCPVQGRKTSSRSSFHLRWFISEEASSRPLSRRRLLACLALLCAASAVPAADVPAPQARLASKALLLDMAAAGPRLVAVGAHGVVVTSDDRGAHWSQARVPVSSMLTCVAFADARQGWAGGHAGVLLATTDGGSTWARVPVDATPDDSFLDLLALPDGRILAGGAYGLYLVSDDNGSTWTRGMALDEDMHLNRFTRGASGTLYLAAEAGILASSTDLGATWARLESPYEGSFYGLKELTSGRLLAYGLRGHVFLSDNQGGSWTQLDTGTTGLLATAIETPAGAIVLSGASGRLLVSADGSRMADATFDTGLKATAEILLIENDTLVCVGDGGVVTAPLPQP